RVKSASPEKRPPTKADGHSSANGMLLAQMRRFPVAASVRIVSMSDSASPERPLACRNSTFMCKKCLSLEEMIKSIFPISDRSRSESAPEVDRHGRPRLLLDRHDLDPLGELAVPGENRSSGDGNVLVSERVQRVLSHSLVEHAVDLRIAAGEGQSAFPERSAIVDGFEPAVKRGDHAAGEPHVSQGPHVVAQTDAIDLPAKELVERQFGVVEADEHDVARVEGSDDALKRAHQALILQQDLIVAAVDPAGAAPEQRDRRRARSGRPDLFDDAEFASARGQMGDQKLARGGLGVDLAVGRDRLGRSRGRLARLNNDSNLASPDRAHCEAPPDILAIARRTATGQAANRRLFKGVNSRRFPPRAVQAKGGIGEQIFSGSRRSGKPMRVLGIETTCDETAAAVVRLTPEGAGEILADEVMSQIAAHAAYGGVVPEIAARAHVEIVDMLIARALAKAGVAANALTARVTPGVAFPYLILLASGGHTQILAVKGVGDYDRLGATLDDAIGEAFDKTAKMLGLSYPG